MTGFPDTKMAGDLLSQGVFDYLVKPMERDKLLAAVNAALAHRLALRLEH